ncbi:hypothetical protein MFIFM68171_08979 [Madurella fahalii]|uniref:Uncharacterized protein n=1 Tax=Madurella fahalii TaxID=1157608 RepID=A0ABQ0GLY7_9PEZI
MAATKTTATTATHRGDNRGEVTAYGQQNITTRVTTLVMNFETPVTTRPSTKPPPTATRATTLVGNMTAVELAARNGHVDVIKAIEDYGPDNHAETRELMTRALLAAAGGRADSAETVTYLLRQDADPRARDSCGRSPPHLAARNGEVNVMRALLAVGWVKDHVDEPGERGRTALHEAVARGPERVVRLLVENGAEVDMKARSGKKPLHAAIQGWHEGVFGILLARTSELSAPCGFGETALHMVANQGNSAMVKALLAHGANRRVRSADGKTALDIAHRQGHEDVCMLLEQFVAS